MSDMISAEKEVMPFETKSFPNLFYLFIFYRRSRRHIPSPQNQL